MFQVISAGETCAENLTFSWTLSGDTLNITGSWSLTPTCDGLYNATGTASGTATLHSSGAFSGTLTYNSSGTNVATGESFNESATGTFIGTR